MKKYLFLLLGLFGLIIFILPSYSFASEWVNIGFPDKEVRSFFVDSYNKNKIIINLGSTSNFTEDGGQNWQSSIFSPSVGYCNDFAQNPMQLNEIWAACYPGLYHSIDNGKTFNKINSFRGINLTQVIVDNNQKVFVNGTDSGVSFSLDGLIWESANSVVFGAGTGQLSFDKNNNLLFYSNYGAGFLRYGGNSNNWIQLNNTEVRSGIYNPLYFENKICGALNGAAFYCSSDGGVSWSSDQGIPYRNYYSIATAQNPDIDSNIVLSQWRAYEPYSNYPSYIYSKKETWQTEISNFQFSKLKISQGAVFGASSRSKNGLWRNDGIAIQPKYEEKYPIIIVPGILGSWQKNGEWKLDPILHTYDYLVNSLKKAGLQEDEDLFYFPYEWRSGNQFNAELLRAKINEVKNKTNKTRVNIVAHSMGGLIAREYAQGNNYQSDIDKIIFLGTPHVGSPKSYPVWEAGDIKFGNELVPGAILNFVFTEEAKINNYFGSTALFDYIRNRVISIRQLLPIFDYLSFQNNILKYPFTYPRNEFLENLEKNKEKLRERGIKIINLIGDNGEKTVSSFNIERTSNLFPFWESGVPINYYFYPKSINYSHGDDTVLSNYTLGVGETNIYLDASHQDLPTKATSLIIKELGKTETPIEVKKNSNILLIGAHSPIDFYVQSPSGKRIGADSNTRKEFGEVEDAFYSGNNPAEPEFVVIRNPEAGEYKVFAVGTGDGKFGIESVYADEETGQEVSKVTEGLISVGKVSEIDVLLEQNKIQSNFNDKIPPITEAIVLGQGTGEYYNSDVQIQLNSQDEGSGVKNIFYSFDKSKWFEYQDSILVKSEGENRLYFKADDYAGNIEQEKTIVIKIDKTIPLINFDISSFYTHWDQLDINPIISDTYSEIKNVKVYLDETEISLGQNLEIFNLGFGKHSINVIAFDSAGNKAEKSVVFELGVTSISVLRDLSYLYQAGEFKSFGAMIRLSSKFQGNYDKRKILLELERELKNNQLSVFAYKMIKNDVEYLLGG